MGTRGGITGTNERKMNGPKGMDRASIVVTVHVRIREKTGDGDSENDDDRLRKEPKKN